jgi:hypothetical protein
MAAYFTGLCDRAPDESSLLLDEIFNLDDQLARLDDDEGEQTEQEEQWKGDAR